MLALLAWSLVATAAVPDDVERWLDSVVLLLDGPSWCSGVVVEPNTVLTAYHCVASGRSIRVSLRGGERFRGTLVAAAPKDDLALLAVNLEGAQVEPLSVRREPLRPGETVIGLGHPFAPYADRTRAMEDVLLWSVTEGIVSAVGARLVQTDTALNPGNSGGPVLDGQGRIVGITSRKLSGDNVAFLSAPNRILALQEERKRPRWIGGRWSLTTALVDGLELSSATAVEILGTAVVRDWWTVSLGVGVPVDARVTALERGESSYLSMEVSSGARLAAGEGRWFTFVELGGGVYGMSGMVANFDSATGLWTRYPVSGDIGPGAYVRLGAGGASIRMVSVGPLDEVDMVAFHIDLPGNLGAF
ncbi:MAG: serine protease [Myxococcota bacterium]|jgi:S1-C subfamily serine protease|nr:serine protease [Myxococcota bacterium]